MPTTSRLVLPGARPAASVPKPPPSKPRPTEPRPAAKADVAARREAAFALLDGAGRAAAERALAGGAARASSYRRGPEGRLVRWAELAGRYAWVGGEPWGNPFRPWLGEGRRPTAEELAESHARYREHVLASAELRARLPELRGKLLACACRPGVPCHGDVLLELLEREGAA